MRILLVAVSSGITESGAICRYDCRTEPRIEIRVDFEPVFHVESKIAAHAGFLPERVIKSDARVRKGHQCLDIPTVESVDISVDECLPSHFPLYIHIRPTSRTRRRLVSHNKPGSLALLDWNGDGLEDVAVAGPSADRVLIYLGDGSAIFGSSIEVSTLTQGDATSELVLGGSFGALILRNDGAGSPGIDALPVGAVIDVKAADLDQDGFTDLVTVAASDRSVQILRNSGTGSFVVQNILRQGSVARVSVADLNGSGIPGLQLAIDGDDLAPPHTLLMNRTSTGTYVAAGTLGASTASDLLTGDIDADGVLDIVAVNEAGVHQLYLAGPGDEYTLGEEQIVSPGMQTGIVADYNLDGSLDLILAGTDARSVELHANNGIGRLGFGDRIAPELTLLGEASVTIASGAEYVDAGATAVDDIDGDLTSAITTTGSVNSAVVGTYRLTFSVSDRATNTSQVTRTVTVGVNQGTGGSGGGMLSLLMLMTLTMFAVTIAVRTRRQTGRL